MFRRGIEATVLFVHIIIYLATDAERDFILCVQPQVHYLLNSPWNSINL